MDHAYIFFRFILRNYIAQNAISAAEKGDFSEVFYRCKTFLVFSRECALVEKMQKLYEEMIDLVDRATNEAV